MGGRRDGSRFIGRRREILHRRVNGRYLECGGRRHGSILNVDRPVCHAGAGDGPRPIAFVFRGRRCGAGGTGRRLTRSDWCSGFGGGRTAYRDDGVGDHRGIDDDRLFRKIKGRDFDFGSRKCRQSLAVRFADVRGACGNGSFDKHFRRAVFHREVNVGISAHRGLHDLNGKGNTRGFDEFCGVKVRDRDVQFRGIRGGGALRFDGLAVDLERNFRRHRRHGARVQRGDERKREIDVGDGDGRPGCGIDERHRGILHVNVGDAEGGKAGRSGRIRRFTGSG